MGTRARTETNARILHFSGEVDGVGFLIGHSMVITCARVYDKVVRDQLNAPWKM